MRGRDTGRGLIWAAALIAAGLCGCGGGDDHLGDQDPPGALTRVDQAILAERPSQVEYAFRQYGYPEIARVAFASAKWNGGCSSTMIGPNHLLTAAHCGPAEADPNQSGALGFMTFRANENERNIEVFRCQRLIHGWPRHDLAVLFCGPNAAGVNPGDKYGYLDLETRAPVLGDRVYSIWWNPVVNGATGSLTVPLYSEGSVVQTNAKIWSGILGGPAGTNVGIKMDTWAQPGASGSSNVDMNTHRILVGPTTLANDPEGPARWAFSTRTYLDSQLLAPGTYPGAGFIENVKASNFPPGTFDFAGYVGKVDKNGNGIFDVQEDIERQRGENRRATYWLGFENRRRNRLWEKGLGFGGIFDFGVSIDRDAKETRVALTGPALVLRHRLLNLKPNTSYRVGMRVRTGSAGNPAALSVGFERLGQAAWSVANLPTTPGTTLLRTAILRTDANPDPFFAIRSTGAFNGAVSEVQLIEDGTTSSFDLIDQREGWKTPFGAGYFLPRGVTSANPGATPDFALWVRALFTSAIPASTDKLLFVPGRGQRLCFKARSIAATTASGVVQITSGATQVRNVGFPLTTNWTTQCFGRIRTAATDTTLTFTSSGNLNSSYLVDDLRVDVDPFDITIDPGGGGGVLAISPGIP